MPDASLGQIKTFTCCYISLIGSFLESAQMHVFSCVRNSFSNAWNIPLSRKMKRIFLNIYCILFY